MSVPHPASNLSGSSSILGREALLRMIETRLQTESRLVIGVDPGLQSQLGVGRTTLVRELVKRRATSETQVIELSGVSPASWHQSLLLAARQLGIRQTRFRRISDLIAAVRSWLSSHDNWLLVADSLADLDDLQEVAGALRSGGVIAVLRQPIATLPAGWPAAIPLGTLPSTDALQLMRLAIDRDWQSTSEALTATKIVNDLERNPLLAELAGRTLWLTGGELSEYRQSLGQNPSQTCLVQLLDALHRTNPTALNVLASGVVMGAVPIPVSTLHAVSDQISGASDAIRLLMDCRLLRWVDDGVTLEVVARESLLTLLPPQTLLASAALVSSGLPPRTIRNRLRENVCGDPEPEVDPLAITRISLGEILAAGTELDPQSIVLIRQAADAAMDLLLPQIAQTLMQRVLDHAVEKELRSEALLAPLVEIGVAFAAGDQFQAARKRWRQAVEFCPVDHSLLTELLLAIIEVDVNENRMDRAVGRLARVSELVKTLPPTPHNQLLEGHRRYLKAAVYLTIGETEKARNSFQAALALRTDLLPESHPLLLRNRLMLARTEFLLKNYPASERLLIDEVAIRERSASVSEIELGVACNFLAEQYYLIGRLSDAEPVYDRLMALRRKTLPQGHRLIGEMANRLAIIKSARGMYKESDALFRESLSSLEQTYGVEHPEVARVLNDLAESLFSQNKVEPARRLLERALSIQEKSLRANDARLGRTRCNLASVYVARGRYDEAVRLYERDVAIRRSLKVTDQASLATSLNNLAEALRSLGRNVEAEERLQQALAIRTQMVGAEHPQVAQILNNLGYLYLQQHQYDAAIETLQRALSIREKCLSPVHPHVATTLGTLAEVYFTMGQYATARPLFFRASEILRTAYGERHPQVASLQISTARNDLRLGHVGRAELMLLRGRTTVDEILGKDHRVSAKVLLGLAELAQLEKRYEIGFPMLERALAIQIGTMSAQRLELAETLRLISENLVARGLAAEALPRITEAVEIQQERLGPHHAEVMPHMLLIGRIHQQLNQAPQAVEAFQFVETHADPATQSTLIAEARERLPDVLIQTQSYDEAVQRLLPRLESLTAAGPSTQLLNSLSQLAGVHYLQSAPEVAAPLMERCVLLSEQLHGHDSAETAKHLDNLAGVRFLLQEYGTAETAIQRAIRILERERPVRPAALTKARQNYIQLLRTTNRIPEAELLTSLVTQAPVAAELFSLPASHVLDD